MRSTGSVVFNQLKIWNPLKASFKCEEVFKWNLNGIS